MTHSYFVTGTDTEVGKTLVSAALVYKLNLDQHGSASAYKPLVAGTYTDSGGQLRNEDIETYLIAGSNQISREMLCPYVLDFPAAPHVVAKERGFSLDMSKMLDGFHRIEQEVEHVIVEGAGGFLTPINANQDLSDFAQLVRLPIILTVGIRLGCLNHTLLTVEAIEKRGLKIAGWVANCISPAMPYREENINTLRQRISAPLLGVIEPLPSYLQKSSNAPYSLKALQFVAKIINLPSKDLT
jgi:dethiobiotin synthetase